MRLGEKIKLSAWYLEVTGGERHKCVKAKRALPTLIRKELRIEIRTFVINHIQALT